MTVRDHGVEQGFIGRERYCARSRRGATRLRCSAPRMTAVTVSVTFATAQTSGAVATGRALVVPGHRDRARCSRRTGAAARRSCARRRPRRTRPRPAALAAAVRTARITAAAAGLPAGTLIAIAEVRRPYEDFSAGSFGPGRFCGLVRRAIVRRDPAHRRVVREVRRRGCFFPRELSVGLRLTYAS